MNGDTGTLVLTCRVGERLMIGETIVVKVVEVRAFDKVRLCIEAPRSIRVDREAVRARKDHTP